MAKWGDGWQPIETAPKDGQLILVYGSGEYWGPMAVVRWNKYNEWVSPIGDAGSYACIFDSDSQPTHWMPLPKPPHD